jgi:hypothetical protein
MLLANRVPAVARLLFDNANSAPHHWMTRQGTRVTTTHFSSLAAVFP